jgi:hypothetical protein
VSEAMFSGVSGYFNGASGYSGARGVSGVSGVSGSGVKNYPHVVTSIVYPNPNPPPNNQYIKQFVCADCGWQGKESSLMDDFKFEIQKAIKDNTVEPPLPPIVNKIQVDAIAEAMQSHYPVDEEKSFKKKLVGALASVCEWANKITGESK